MFFLFRLQQSESDRPTERCLADKTALESETAREKRVAFEARAAVSEEQLEQAMSAARQRAENRWRTDLEKSAANKESALREEEAAKVRCQCMQEITVA